MSLEGTLVEVTPMRRAIARRMVESKQRAPHFYVSTDIEMDKVLAALEDVRAANDAVRVTATTALVRACVVALAEHPQLNCVWTERGLLQVPAVNLCVAVAVDDGLIAPALLDAGRLDLVGTAAALAGLVERARARKLKPAEISDGTFTLSNLGMFPVTSFTAIITPPQVAILATGRTERRVIPDDGDALRVASVLTATLSADHSAVDGADAAAFLDTLKQVLEQPERLLQDDRTREEARA